MFPVEQFWLLLWEKPKGERQCQGITAINLQVPVKLQPSPWVISPLGLRRPQGDCKALLLLQLTQPITARNRQREQPLPELGNCRGPGGHGVGGSGGSLPYLQMGGPCPVLAEPCVTPSAPPGLPRLWGTPTFGHWHNEGSWAHPWHKAALSQAAPAHTRGCWESSWAGPPCRQGRGWALPMEVWLTRAVCIPGLHRSCSGRAHGIAGSPWESRLDLSCCCIGTEQKWNQFHAQSTHLSWNLPIGEEAELSAQMKAINKNNNKKETLAVLIVWEQASPTTVSHSWQCSGVWAENTIPILRTGTCCPLLCAQAVIYPLTAIPGHFSTMLSMVLWWQQCITFSTNKGCFTFSLLFTKYPFKCFILQPMKTKNMVIWSWAFTWADLYHGHVLHGGSKVRINIWKIKATSDWTPAN